MARANDGPDNRSAASISIDGIKFFQAENVSIEKFELDEIVEYDIKGEISAGRRQTTFSITLPELAVGVYSKEQHGSLAAISLMYANSYLSSSGPFIPDVKDLGDYVIEVTAVSDGAISGNFIASVQDGMTQQTLQVSGEFTVSKNSLWL